MIPAMIPITRYPQLRAVAWQICDDAMIDEEQALRFYERNWIHVDDEKMLNDERQFLQKLIREQGNGVFLV